MAELFADVSQLGRLFYHHTYLFYDEPQLFSCFTPTFQYYLVVAIPSDVGDAWLAAPISPGRLAQLEQNKIEIRRAFTEPESILWKLEERDAILTAYSILPNSLTDDLLPNENTFLDYYGSGELTESEKAPLEQSTREMRDVIEISFEKDDSHIQEISCVALGDSLKNIQELIYALGNKEGGLRGTIPKRIREDCELCVTGLFAASVGVRLKSDELCDLEFKTPLTDTLANFNRLFEIAGDKELLNKFLSTQNPRVAIKYRALIRTLLNNCMGIRINNASPNKSVFTRHFTTKELAVNLSLINSEIDEITEEVILYGSLVGINVERGTFEFISTEKESIKGMVSSELQESTFSIPQEVQAAFIITVGTDSLTKEEKLVYKLTGLSPIVDKDES
jgi:hypothetical protein